jgi:REP-associated tyrosine transposase
MARPPRISIPVYPHHIIQRGNNRQPIFFAEGDYHYFLDCLQRAKMKYSCRIYAYVLMTNHVHLIIEPPHAESLGQLMQSVGRRYVRYINQTYRRSGTLWEGRFKSAVVSRDEHLMQCGRYIEMNPVRAGLVKGPSEYRWSSYRLRALGIPDHLLDLDPWYTGLAEGAGERQKIYREWVSSSIPNEEWDRIRKATQRGRVIGGDIFRKRVEAILGRHLQGELRGRPRKKGMTKQKIYSDPNFLMNYFDELPIEQILGEKAKHAKRQQR